MQDPSSDRTAIVDPRKRPSDGKGMCSLHYFPSPTTLSKSTLIDLIGVRRLVYSCGNPERVCLGQRRAGQAAGEPRTGKPGHPVSVEAAGRPYSAPPAAGPQAPGKPRQRKGVKLGPIGARRVRAGLSSSGRNRNMPLFSGSSAFFNRPKKWLDIKPCGPGAPRLALSFADDAKRR
jgi:hypothetical protein